MADETCRYPCGCEHFPEEHCACMEGHPTVADKTNAGGLTDAEKKSLADVIWPPNYADPNLETVAEAVERIVAEREAAAREQGRAEAEENAYQRGLVEGREQAETRDLSFDALTDELAGLVAAVEALDRSGRMSFNHADLRALRTADHTKTLDAAKVQAWDEGHVWACEDSESVCREFHLVVNPYRADRLTTGTP